MATFSENQVSHLYVAKSLVATASGLNALTTAGAIQAKKDVTGKKLYFNYVNAMGDKIRTDLIDIDKILWANATPASKMERNLTKKTVTIPSSVTAGDQYYVRVDFRQYAGQTDSDTYVQWANALVKSASTATTVAAELAKLLKASLGRDPQPVVNVTVSGTVITLTEVEQPWVKGTMASVPVYFDVHVQRIYTDSASGLTEVENLDDAVANATGSVVRNGKKTADLEWFLLGERGDQYRGVGYPNTIETEGLADSSSAYDYINIHYFADECGTNNAKSEKDLIIAVPTDKAAAVATLGTETLKVTDAINAIASTGLPTE